ncbi:nucleotidyltransferase family protein [Casimicrobium huifangae]|uniref:nucleotidyltransferase family protein n=1 Tax=Casimicrobium huifangae TaxID=2591109 RepID=UPI0013969825
MKPLSPTAAARLALATLIPVDRAHGDVDDDSSPDIVRSQLGDQYLIRQGLAPLWSAIPCGTDVRRAVVGESPARNDPLAAVRTAAVAKYLLHCAALSELDHAFQVAGIRYAVFKGAHIREWIYRDPTLRDPADVDVLIAAEDNDSAISALMDAGFEPQPDSATVSHELIMLRRGIEIDLHWHIVRPGRLRTDITADLLSRRQRMANIWTLAPSDAALIMLLHPAFTKYVSSPSMRLVRVHDFLLVVRDQPIDWNAVATQLERCGTRGAGWAVLKWFQLLHPLAHEVPGEFEQRLRPGVLRRAYIHWWLERDLPTRLHAWPLIVQFGFTLALHDTPQDAVRALVGIFKARRSGRNHRFMAVANTDG